MCIVCTSLLLCKQGKFLAFGSTAREDYYEHDESGMLFEKFKMRLHDDHRGSEPIAFALNGKTLSLLKVITHSLKYVKEDAMAEINRSQPKALFAHEIKWVITGKSHVPDRFWAWCTRSWTLGTRLRYERLSYSLFL